MSKGFSANLGRRLRGIFLSLDYFGQPVSLTYNKENFYKTYQGGIMSLLLFGVILGFLGAKI